MKPIIGIVEWPYVDKDGDYIYEILNPVVEWVNRCGGTPIGIFPTQIAMYVDTRLRDIRPMNSNERKDLIDTLRMCSAIIKPGATKIYDHERFIYDYVFKNNMPYLGICAGMQLMASYGKDQIENEKNENNNHHSKATYVHEINILRSSKLFSILKEDTIMVNSRHNNHIKDSGVQRVCALSRDNIIEAIENRNSDFQYGVQWHPELLPENDLNSQKLFNGLIESAYQYKKNKRF